LELAKEDAKELEDGVEAMHKISMTTFLVKGLDLEEQQYVISRLMSLETVTLNHIV